MDEKDETISGWCNARIHCSCKMKWCTCECHKQIKIEVSK
jgi:hypothetical protein